MEILRENQEEIQMNTTLQTFATHNDLPQRVRSTLLPLLNQQLADTFDLYSQVKQAHWTVKGMHFCNSICSLTRSPAAWLSSSTPLPSASWPWVAWRWAPHGWPPTIHTCPNIPLRSSTVSRLFRCSPSVLPTMRPRRARPSPPLLTTGIKRQRISLQKFHAP